MTVAAHAPCEFDPERRHPTKTYEVSVRATKHRKGARWHPVSNEHSAEWALTITNMIRRERPHLTVRVVQRLRV
jgi:hypothetical protein